MHGDAALPVRYTDEISPAIFLSRHFFFYKETVSEVYVSSFVKNTNHCLIFVKIFVVD